MSDIEAIQTSIHLNLLLAKDNMKQKDFELAIYQIQDARNLLEKLESLILQDVTSFPNMP